MADSKQLLEQLRSPSWAEALNAYDTAVIDVATESLIARDDWLAVELMWDALRTLDEDVMVSDRQASRSPHQPRVEPAIREPATRELLVPRNNKAAASTGRLRDSLTRKRKRSAEVTAVSPVVATLTWRRDIAP